MLFICWAAKSATAIQMVCCMIMDTRFLLSKILHLINATVRNRRYLSVFWGGSNCLHQL